MHIENENIIRKLFNNDEVKNKLKKYRYYFFKYTVTLTVFRNHGTQLHLNPNSSQVKNDYSLDIM